MNTNKLTYWLALGVFALGLRSEYESGRFPAFHRVADHAGSALCRIASRAEQTVALVRVTSNRSATDWLASVRDGESGQVGVLRDEALAHAELIPDQVLVRADLIRAQSKLQRSQIEPIQWHIQPQFELTNGLDRQITLVCPKTGARISVTAGSTDVDVSDSF